MGSEDVNSPRPPQTEDFADSQTEAQSNQHDGPKGLNQSVEYLPSILYLKDLRTLLAPADALHFDQVYGVSFHIQQFPKHRFVEKTVHEGPNVALVFW
jgi:hypothetical protein